MLSKHKLHGINGLYFYDSGQVPGVSRPAVVGRRVVVQAARLPAKNTTADVDSLLSSSFLEELKPKQPTLTARSRTRSSLPAHESPASHLPESFSSSTPTAASLRDATATASTSGHTHLPHTPSAQLTPKRRKATLTTFASRKGPASSNTTSPQVAVAVAATIAATARSAAAVFSVDEHFTAAAGSPPPLPSSTGEGGEHPAALEDAPSVLAAKRAASSNGDGGHGESATGHPLPPGVTPDRDRDIHSELKACEEWRDVLDVVADELAHLSVRTAVHALTRLNTLTRGSAASRRALNQMPDFIALTQTLYAQIDAMNNVQLSNSLSALAQLQVGLPDEVMSAFCSACVARAASFYPRDIATTFSALATLSATNPPQELLDTLGFRATGFLTSHTFEPRGIPTLLHACAVLGYNNPILAGAAAQQLAVPGVMEQLIPQGVSNSLWALGRMGCYHPPAVEAALTAFTSAPVGAYKPQEAANLLWALTAFRHQPGAAFATFAKSLLLRLAELRPADIATLIYAIAFFNVAPDSQLLSRVSARTMELLNATPPPGLASSSASSPSAQSSRAIPPASSPSPASSITSEANSESEPESAGPSLPTSGSGRWGSKRGLAAVTGGSGAGRGQAGALALVELCNLYWGLALLGEVRRPLLGRLEAALTAEWEAAGGQMPNSLARMVFQGFLASRLAESSSDVVRPSGFQPLALDAFKRAWTGTVIALSSKAWPRTVERVAAILDTLKVPYDARRPTKDGLVLIDLALRAGPDRYVALQVLEEYHTTANSKQLLGTTILQRQMLEKNGWEVRFLAATELERLSPDTQVAFVRELLVTMGVKVRTQTQTRGAAATGAAAGGQREERWAAKGPGGGSQGADAAEAAAASAALGSGVGGGRGERSSRGAGGGGRREGASQMRR